MALGHGSDWDEAVEAMDRRDAGRYAMLKDAVLRLKDQSFLDYADGNYKVEGVPLENLWKLAEEK